MTPGPVPTSIAPWLAVADATRAVAFYADALGAATEYRLDGDDGTVAVARLAVDGAAFWVQQDDAGLDPRAESSVRMILTVDDPDAAFDRAVAAGATVVAPVAEEYGWRTGRVTDPFGHDWELSRPAANGDEAG